MSTTLSPGYVVPNPSIPKVLGFLNIVFGSLLLLAGVATIGWLVIAPSATRAAQSVVTSQAEAAKKAQAAEVARLKALVASAKTEEERREHRASLREAQAQPPPKLVNLRSRVSSGLDDLVGQVFNWGAAVTGVLLNVAMIAAGAGLIGLRAWGRRLALGVAGLKLIRLAAIAAVTLFILIPQNTREIQRMALEDGAEAENAPPSAQAQREAAQFAQLTAAASSVYAVGFLVFGAIYPIAVLFLLTRRSARAAIVAANRPPRSKPNRPDPAATLE